MVGSLCVLHPMIVIATLAAAIATAAPVASPAPASPALVAQASTEPKTSPGTPDALPEEVTKHLADLCATYDRFVDAYVLKANETSVGALDKSYGKALETARDSFTKKGDLDAVVAIKAELQRMASHGDLPESDKGLHEVVLPLRTTYRTEFAKLEQAREDGLLDANKRYDLALAQYQVQLTQTQALEAAMHVKKLREVLAAKGGVPPKGGFTNSLGMKFVPVPGTQVLFCIHHTRYRDYAAYAAEAPGIRHNWKQQTVTGHVLTEHTDEHPVIGVTWEEAKNFCAWLSQKEGRTYRLPTDQEWSIAVGLGSEEKWTEDTTPESVIKNKDLFPWGKQWPPPSGAGNYSDQTRKVKAPGGTSPEYIDDYDDGYATTSPVMSFAPNKFGLYDMGGNVWQWCEDWWNASKVDRVLRGGAWDRSERLLLLSSARLHHPPTSPSANWGFRIVAVADKAGDGKPR